MEKLTDLIKQQNEITQKIFNILREHSDNVPMIYAAHAQDDIIINNVAFFDPSGGDSRYELEITREVDEKEQNKPEVFIKNAISKFKQHLVKEAVFRNMNGSNVDGESYMKDVNKILK